MAVTDSLPGLKVTIESQGKPLEEHADESEWVDPEHNTRADKRSSVYVECVSDATFQVSFSIEPPFQLPGSGLYFLVSVDGQKADGSTVRSLSGGRHLSYVSEIRTRISFDQVSYRSLKFSSIRKVDDGDSCRVKKDAEIASSGLGEILVRVYRYSAGVKAPVDWNRNTKSVNAAPTEIAEKALKGRALSHGIGFGEERHERCHSGSKSIQYIDGHKNPFAMFRFKYRSREALQQEMIIPRSESPEVVIGPLNPRRDDNDSSALSREERLSQLKREIELIKSEVKEETGESSARGKKRSNESAEPSSGRAFKTSRNNEGIEVVDLSDD